MAATHLRLAGYGYVLLDQLCRWSMALSVHVRSTEKGSLRASCMARLARLAAALASSGHLRLSLPALLLQPLPAVVACRCGAADFTAAVASHKHPGWQASRPEPEERDRREAA